MTRNDSGAGGGLPGAATNTSDDRDRSAAAVDPASDGEDFYGDLRPILADDLAAFVRIEDRHKSLTVVREEGDQDLIGEARRRIDRIRADAAAVEACRAMRTIVDRYADGSRGSQLRGAIAAVRLDELGHRGLAAALDALLSVRAKDPRDFWRLVEFATRVVLSKPSRPEDIGCRCNDGRPGGIKIGESNVTSGEPTADDHGDGPPPVVVRLPILPAEFWAARPVLAHIRRAAHSRLVSADLVLHAVLAKLSGMRSHELWLDSGRGESSLNYFCAPVGPSGVGKTTGAAVADELLAVPAWLVDPPDDADPEPFRDGVPLGSGEGIAELYMGLRDVQVGEKKDGTPITKPVRAVVRHNAFVLVDEGEAFTRQGERTGNNTSSTLRSAWSGATIGQANGRTETSRVVKAGQYALGMVVGFQVSTALPLLEDTAPGTAQRFAWVSAVDPTLPDEPVEYPGRLSVDLADETFRNTPRTGPVAFPAGVVAELGREHRAKVRGEVVVAERDSQGPLMRAKMAALLALLDGRAAVTDEDWQLAGVMWATSCAVRDAVVDLGRQERAREAEERNAQRVQIAERTAAAVAQVGPKVARLAETLAGHVLNEGGLTRSAARKKMPSRDRGLFDQVAEYAESIGALRLSPDGALLPPLIAV